MSLVAMTRFVSKGNTVRFTFIRIGQDPVSAHVRQQDRDEEKTLISEHDLTMSYESESTGEIAYFDLYVRGDCLVTLNTGETKMFYFDTLENDHENDHGNDSDSVNDVDYVDEPDEYGDAKTSEMSHLKELSPPILAQNESSYAIAWVPYGHFDDIYVRILDEEGNEVVMENPYFWTDYTMRVINGIICSGISIWLYEKSLRDKQYNQHQLLNKKGQWSYVISVTSNPFNDPVIKTIQKDELYKKEYGGLL